MADTIKLTFIASVGADYIGGKKYDVPVDLANEYIHKGYASGTPSRSFSEKEKAELDKTTQKVGY